jgi:hypothetical protein
MGYHTDFDGRFEIKPTLSQPAIEYIKKFNKTRRVKRQFENDIHGIDGEFYVDGGGFRGQDSSESSIVNYNQPPRTQPGLWCQWTVTDCGNFLEWDEGEKFYSYVEWLSYMINSFFHPNGYMLSGEVSWEGEERGDFGTIIVKNNIITVGSEITPPKTRESQNLLPA